LSFWVRWRPVFLGYRSGYVLMRRRAGRKYTPKARYSHITISASILGSYEDSIPCGGKTPCRRKRYP